MLIILLYIANIQIPYLINIAVLVADILPTFPASPRTTFYLVDKLDHAFCSLLQGKEIETGDPLPGFEEGSNKKVSTTERIRIKSIVERTRVAIAQMLAGAEMNPETADEVPLETSDEEDSMDEDDGEGVVEEEEEDLWDMEIGSVYARTIGELGEELGAAPIGIVTDGDAALAPLPSGVVEDEADDEDEEIPDDASSDDMDVS